MRKPLKEIPAPFGNGLDEQAMHRQFEELVGVQRGFQLMRIWENSRPVVWSSVMHGQQAQSREYVFRKRAHRDGFTDTEIDAYLQL